MVRHLLAAWLVVAASAAGTPSEAGTFQPTPAAVQLFERDWVLMNWALKFYDANRDVLLQPDEAAAASAAFRKLADSDNDGRVTPQEFQQARAFILARY